MKKKIAALAIIPLVFGSIAAVAAPKAKLPLVVYSNAGASNLPYVPSGYMGDTNALNVDDSCKVKPHSGSTCIAVTFSAKDWAGIVWQSPANDWGDKPGGYNLSGARKLTFWARGKRGGEHVEFKFGLLGAKARYRDSASGDLQTTLTSGWKQYTIGLAGKNLSDIKTGFVFVVSGSPQTFYIYDIRYQ
jgi:hypothetical protein